MDSAKYGTSDIEWKRLDPKTVELTNKPPMEPPGLPPMPAMRAMTEEDKIRAMAGTAMTQSELENMQKGMGMRQRTRPEPSAWETDRPPTKRDWRRQFRGFERYLDSGGSNMISGIQELVDSGALSVTPDGNVYSNVPFHGDNDRLLDLVGRWNDFQNDLADEVTKLGPDSTTEQRKQLFDDMLRERGEMQDKVYMERGRKQ